MTLEQPGSFMAIIQVILSVSATMARVRTFFHIVIPNGFSREESAVLLFHAKADSSLVLAARAAANVSQDYPHDGRVAQPFAFFAKAGDVHSSQKKRRN